MLKNSKISRILLGRRVPVRYSEGRRCSRKIGFQALRKLVDSGVATMFQSMAFVCIRDWVSKLGLVVLLTAALNGLTLSESWAQKKKGLQTIKGKLVSLEKKGRLAVLTVETEDKEKKEIPVTSRTAFAITAKGDDGFLAPGQFISTIAVLTNKRLFAKQYTVYVGKGRKPRSGIAKARKKIGQSVNSYAVAGLIVSRQQDRVYKDYQTVTLKGSGNPSVFLDKGYSVTVSSSDPALAKPGSAVELIGRQRGKKFTVTKVTIKLSAPLKSAEVLTTSKTTKKKKSKSKKKKSKKKKSKKQ